MAQTPLGLTQATLYFSTTTGGATPATANAMGEFRGEPVVNITQASATWRGQDRVAKHVIMHDTDITATIPGFTFDSSEVLAQFADGTHTSATTTHGGSQAAREDKWAKNTKFLEGEWLLEGKSTEDETKVVQLLFHQAFMTGANPTVGRTDFATLDLNLTLLQDASGDVFSVYQE